MPNAQRKHGGRYSEQLQLAVDLHARAQLAEAEQIYRGLLQEDCAEHGPVHFVLGLLLTQRGDPEAALAEYDHAASRGYATAALFQQRGDLNRLQGRFEEALCDYELALSHQPQHAVALHGKGLVLAGLGRFAAAEPCYNLALALNPGDTKVLNNKGVALEALGRLDDAVASYDAAIAADPDYVYAHHNRGSALLKAAQYEHAAASFRRALTIREEIPECWNLLGVALAELSSHGEALIAFERAVALRPAYAEALNNRSAALRWTGRFEDAVASATAALDVDPTLSSAFVNRGAALGRLNDYAGALQDFEAALALTPASAPAILSRGLAREALGDLDSALADFATASELMPNKPDARICAGLTHIRRGNFQQGFALYQWRWRKPTGPFLPHSDSTLWTGEQPVDGRSVLLHAEQGYGDVIQFCRFAADVARRGARVSLQVQPALKRLVKSLAGPAEVLSLDEPAPSFDLQAPLMNLPSALGISLQDLAARSRYLSAPQDAIDVWNDRLGERRRPRIGLAWNGAPWHENDHNRSAPLDAVAPLFETSADFLSLQKIHRPEDMERLDSIPSIRCFGESFSDFADVAAVIEHCDLIVTVDTAVAHLAGALNKPVLILLPRFADWRWMEGRSDSPWYPSARLLRQTSFGDWSGPVTAAAAAIAKL